jgi:hypothetical protein
MVHIVSSLYIESISENNNVENGIKAIFQEREIAKLIGIHKGKEIKIQWQQSCTTDGKNLYIVLTAIVMTC